MKTTILSLFTALVLLGSFKAHAIPPFPPSTNNQSMFEEESDTVTCKDINALTTEEINYLEEHEDSIVSAYLDIRYLCYRNDL